MIVFKKFGYTFKIRNDDWKDLRKRFNPKHAVNYGGHWRIKIACSLCERYRGFVTCPGCPFDILGEYGCEIFVDKLFRERKFGAGIRFISWNTENNASARKQLRRIQKMMDEIEVQNGKI